MVLYYAALAVVIFLLYKVIKKVAMAFVKEDEVDLEDKLVVELELDVERSKTSDLTKKVKVTKELVDVEDENDKLEDELSILESQRTSK